jgi:SAM-dependent methyltransferase
VTRQGAPWKTRLIERYFDAELRDAAPHVKGVVVDAGCGDKPFRSFFEPLASCYWGLDLSRGAADVLCDVRHLPLADQSVDTIVMFQVLDDVPEPLQLLAEVRRVLKPEGALLLSVNQSWRVHNAPHDYFRFTPFGLRYLLGRVGMNVVSIHPMGGMWAYFGNRLAFWLDEGPGRNRFFEPFVRVAGSILLRIAGIVDRRDFHPEDTQNKFVVATRAVGAESGI